MIRLKQWQWELLAPLFGVILTLAFAPYDFAYLALIALLFFYRLCLTPSAGRAALRGFLFGLGLFGCGVWWVYISIHQFGGGDPVYAGFLTLLLVGLCATFPALTAYLTAKVFAVTGVWFRILAAALIWVSVEYFRGYWLLNGFPWLQIAYSQLNSPLAGYAAVFGVYGLGFMLAASASSMLEMWRGKLSPLHGLNFLALIWGVGWFLQDVQWTQAIGQPVKVTLVQGNIAQDQKWQPQQRLNILNLYRQLTEQHWDSDVIIWPETAVPAFLEQVRAPYLAPLGIDARKHGVDLLISLPSSGSGKDYYNTVMVLGESEALYHKRHLLPFGEYLPLQPLSGWVLEQLRIPLGSFAAGADDQPLLQAGGYAFITTICYEDVFAELLNSQLDKAAYLVNVTNDAWFGDTSQPYQHMQMAQMRALETGRYLVRATNTGLTGFVMPNGKISRQAPLFTTTTLTGSITPMTGLTPYARLGDDWIFAGMAGLVLSVFGLTGFKP